MDTVILSLQLPDFQTLSPNARKHWAQKSAVVRTHRAYAARMAETLFGLSKPLVMAYKLKFYWPNRIRRDRDNASACCKAYLDGLSDFLDQDDSGFAFNGVEFDMDKDRPRVEIILTVKK